MLDFLSHLFDTSGFPPRWQCGDWSNAHGWFHIVSDLAVGGAYFAIPCILAYFVLRRRDVPFSSIFWLFVAFILACGTTHLMEAVIFWHPLYRLAGVIKFATACVSWATVVALVPTVPKALAMRSPEELERESAARQNAERALKQANADLEARVYERTGELAKANADLRYQREMLRITLASIGDGVVTTDTEGRVDNMNAVAESLTGWKAQEAFGQPLDAVFRIVNEETRTSVESPATRAIREGVIVGLANHTILIGKDGTERAVDDSAAPIRCARGEIVGSVLVFRDVTERRRMERATHSLASIVESSDDAIIGEDTNGIITSWNRAAERLFGYSAGEAIGRPVAMLAPPDRPDEIPAILGRIRRGEQVEHLDTLRRAKDNRLIPVVVTVSPIKDEEGRLVGASKIIRDSSNRKRAEEALRESERREKERAAELEALLRATPTPIWIAHDPQCHRITGNPASLKFLGLPEGTNVSAKATSRGFQEYRDSQPIPVEELPMQVAAAKGVEVRGAEIKFVFDDGRVRYIYGDAVPLRGSDGQVRGAIGAFADVTPLKEAEDALRGADRRKDEFLATLAHELRNPLAPIRNAVELLQRARGNAEVIEKSTQMIERQVRHVVRLVDDLLEVSRTTKGKVQLRKEGVELAAVVQSAVEATRPFIEAQRHQLTLTLPQQPIHLHADPTRFAQVFANLLDNAAKYTEKGGRIGLVAEREGSEVKVTVRDTGIGIAAEHLSHIFDIFSQVEPALERSHGGLGIGLALVKGLVESHGGTIEAQSGGRGRGSEFIVRLPVVETPIPALVSGHENEAKARTDRQHRILVVDDNRDAADSLALMLRMIGHETATAYDGSAALQTAQTFRPDVVLLDIGLPKMNGYEVARHIRQKPWGKGMALIAVTGWGQEDDKRRALEAGFDHHLTKPVEAEALQRLLAIITPKPPQ